MAIINRFTNARPREPRTRKYRAEWYDTRRWRNVRKHHLMNNPLCVHCRDKGLITAATVLDHIKNVGSYEEHERETAFWNEDNWQGLCVPCHNRKSQKEKVI